MDPDVWRFDRDRDLDDRELERVRCLLSELLCFEVDDDAFREDDARRLSARNKRTPKTTASKAAPILKNVMRPLDAPINPPFLLPEWFFRRMALSSSPN